MATPSVTYTFSNGTTADAGQVNTNFTDVINALTDGNNDFSIAALTCSGTATLNGNVTLGNAGADDLTVNASLASNIPIKTNDSVDIGSSSLGLQAIYLGGTGGTTGIKGAASITTYTFTLPSAAGSDGQALGTSGSGTLTWLNDLGMLGEFKHSMLTQAQIDTIAGSGKWLLCNGQSCSGSDYETLTSNSTVPDLTTANRFLRAADGSTLSAGDLQNDQMQGHAHNIDRGDGSQLYWNASAGAATTGVIGTDVAATYPVDTLDTKSDGVNGTPRTGTTTYPINMAVNIFIKVNN